MTHDDSVRASLANTQLRFASSLGPPARCAASVGPSAFHYAQATVRPRYCERCGQRKSLQHTVAANLALKNDPGTSSTTRDKLAGCHSTTSLRSLRFDAQSHRAHPSLKWAQSAFTPKAELALVPSLAGYPFPGL